MTSDPNQREDHAIVRYEGRSNDAVSPVEKTRWKRFLEFLHLSSCKTHEFGEAYAGAEVAKKENEAAKLAAEAADIVAKSDLTRAQTVKVVNEEIQRIFTNKDLPREAKAMQLSVLAKEHPEILAQLKIIEEHAESSRVTRGVQIQLIEDRKPSPDP
ncbi:MAG: hypothetical protein O7D91_09765 [Planctomycetota bacterium]|nr:hypothetical protein [Planctomycetota bacterium]